MNPATPVILAKVWRGEKVPDEELGLALMDVDVPPEHVARTAFMLLHEPMHRAGLDPHGKAPMVILKVHSKMSREQEVVRCCLYAFNGSPVIYLHIYRPGGAGP